MDRKRMRRRVGAAMITVTLSCAALVGIGGTAASAQVRGFDGKTITVAGLGIKAQLPQAEVGAEARIKRFNDTNEIKGIELEYAELADDKQDTATALAEARRLVTQENVFAIVGDVSANNPGAYFTQQKVPYFGGGFDSTYCSEKPSTALWGFSFTGCIVPEDPSFVGNLGLAPYNYVSRVSGKEHPTAVVIGGDTASSEQGNRNFAISYQGAGFKVVDVQNNVPVPSPADYTPFVQDALTGDDGKAPDVIFCQLQVDCLPIYTLLRASGYEGTYIHGLYTDVLVEALEGSVTFGPYVNYGEDTPGYRMMKEDLEAVEPGSSETIDFASLAGYASADMFIEVLKKVAAKGKSNITPENVQKAAAKMSYTIDGIYGPIEYPKSTVYSFPACLSLSESNGQEWETVEPLTCSTKTYSPNTKLG